jgi:hypothetical protein
MCSDQADVQFAIVVDVVVRQLGDLLAVGADPRSPKGLQRGPTTSRSWFSPRCHST